MSLITGAGFDFDVYAWDPNTRDIVMRLVGHFKSLTGIALVVTPNEKIATVDEGGVIKVWNIDKEQVGFSLHKCICLYLYCLVCVHVVLG